MHARFFYFNKFTLIFRVRWFIRMDDRWSWRKVMADPMLSPRHGAEETPTCPTHYFVAYDYVEETETLV